MKTVFKVDRDLVKLTVEFDDAEAIKSFYKFILENTLEPAVSGNFTQGKRFEGFFKVESAEKIIKFLKSSGAKNNQLIKS